MSLDFDSCFVSFWAAGCWLLAVLRYFVFGRYYSYGTRSPSRVPRLVRLRNALSFMTMAGQRTLVRPMLYLQ